MTRTRTRTEMMAYALEMDEALLPHASELLADLTALGSDADTIAEVLAELGVGADSFVVDLGCGKGAAAVAIASLTACRVVGIDLHSGLVADARVAAERVGVADRCEFLVGEIESSVGRFEPADAVVFAALGDVLGPLDATIAIIRRFVRPGGFIVVDDSFVTAPGARRFEGFEYSGTLEETRSRLTAHGDDLVRELVEEPSAEDTSEADLIEARANDLARHRPELEPILREFVSAQRAEYGFLDAAMAGAVWVLRRAAS